MIGLLAEKASECNNIFTIGKVLKKNTNKELTNEQESECKNLGMSWLNRLAQVIKNGKVSVKEDLLLIPDWYGNLHPSNEVIYDGTILDHYKHSDSLIKLVDSELWSHFHDKKNGDDNMTSTIVHPQYVFAKEFQNNTDKEFFDLVDRLVFFCSEHNSTEWKLLLKRSIQTLLFFFESNESISKSSFSYRNRDDDNLSKLFPKTYMKRKNLSYDYIYDAETKARFSQMNDNYSSDEIEILIENKDFVKKILQRSELVTIQKIIEEFPDTDFKSILNILRREQGDFNLELFQQNISDDRKRDIGDKGECYVYEMLCSHFGCVNVTWSNYAPNDANARIVSFNGKEYRLTTTSHDFDFVVSYNGKSIFIEVKTTVGNIKCSKDFPLIFETKEWEWIDNLQNQGSLHYIVRVFDIEGSPKAYFLKQSLFVE